MRGPEHLDLSGERFAVVYRLTGSEAEARARADDLCVEQTVEFPRDLLPPGEIPERVVGRVESFRRVSPDRFEARLSYAAEVVGGELTQLLNVAFGNASILPGVRVERLDPSPALLEQFRGPRFGCTGLRNRLGAERRPLVCTAVKPLGLTPGELSEMAFQLAKGGVDLIKDDHGLADQPFCPFEERVAACADAVARANRATGGRTLYLPNVTAPHDRLTDRVRVAKATGAGGLLISPGLVGFDAMRRLALDAIDLPILSHPAFLGSFLVSPDAGISHYALLGQLMRLAGADACIFPNFGGRFAFKKDDCLAAAAGMREPMASIDPIFPVPAGGMSLDRVGEMRAFYGDELIVLIGGDLHRHGPDLTAACRRFVALVAS